ncbi:prolyl aminopeptidase [Stenotrophomonas sp. 24(2023)]|uniref:prolyl aminopeptidase n=1 Tax=Stenotrophomonas sp. 24(2023) TaxID=3068324 RepID=UPI0027DF666E|nr:prolyl aminopeptidase [Stenotrophomonas sp. 24(2023)]WMJ68717.1 prolyl aminopeptidase [Stenotrophomonas sp. 24(2023)]
MRTLYPDITPFREHRIAVDGLHTLHVEECGNPDGIPVLFLHGGPGAGVSPLHRRFFDPARYHIVLIDQRGSGRSTPFGELRDNTTAHLVADIETVRAQLGIERWLVFGGSWGSTLSLAYAQAHPQRATGVIVRGIYLGRAEENRWFNECDGGARWVFPERWAAYEAHIPEAERGAMIEAYWRRLDSPDTAIAIAAAQAWLGWEDNTVSLVHDVQAVSTGDPLQVLAKARIEAHYFRNNAFLDHGQLLRDIDRIRHLPGVIVQGRYDMLCPARNAWELSQAWPEATLEMVLGGHSVMDAEVTDALVRATDDFADRYAQR